MDSLIRETNDNLKVILSTLKNNLDNSISTLDNIQINMDKKVEEAKKYKIQVDSAKEKIKELEENNKSLELSLKELNDRYGKMNLVSLVETGNKEIKTKINENNREINREKEHIADLTNKARTIKDLLINLKKDKTIKEERLENLKTVYDYYETRINEIIDYAFNHSENLNDYKDSYSFNEEIDSVEISDNELENTMVFDEIANIDDNNNFKDEMTFIDGQINDLNNDNNIKETINKTLNEFEINEPDEEVKVIETDIDSTQVFDSIFDENISDEETKEEPVEKKVINNSDLFIINDDNKELEEQNEIVDSINEEITKEEITKNENNEIPEIEEKEPVIIEEYITDLNELNNEESKSELVEEKIEDISINEEEKDEDFKTINNLDIFNIKDEDDNNLLVEEPDESEERINKINDLFSSIDNTKTNNIPINNISKVENEIDSAYKDIFGEKLEENDLNKTITLTDIFGNPIKKEEISEEVKKEKKLEELFVENGIDFTKFKEDEQNYLKQIYDEEKFNNILNTLKRNKINLDNIYNSFNIFGEISANELESIISKLINSGQSVEAIGLILEKLPKVKKYNLSDAIISYGDYIKDIDITELIMKAKELYDGGNK